MSGRGPIKRVIKGVGTGNRPPSVFCQGGCSPSPSLMQDPVTLEWKCPRCGWTPNKDPVANQDTLQQIKQIESATGDNRRFKPKLVTEDGISSVGGTVAREDTKSWAFRSKYGLRSQSESPESVHESAKQVVVDDELKAMAKRGGWTITNYQEVTIEDPNAYIQPGREE